MLMLGLLHFLQYITFQGYHSISKPYPGKVALSTLAKSIRNKVIIDIGNLMYELSSALILDGLPWICGMTC